MNSATKSIIALAICLYCYIIISAMVRQPRIQSPGAYYHIVSRGNEKRDIFVRDADRFAFLKILDEVASERSWECYAYCLMTNHYHLLIQTPAPDLADGMKRINGVYSQRFNAIHGRTGHLFQGRCFSKLIKEEGYLLAAVRYLVQNPVRAGFCAAVGDWRWSSHPATAGAVPLPRFLRADFVLSQFSDEPRAARRAYAEFVGQAPADIPSLKRVLYYQREPRRGSADLASIIKAVSDREIRNLEIFEAYNRHGYRMTEIADYLGLHYSSISKIIREVSSRSGAGSSRSGAGAPKPRGQAGR